MSTGRPRTRIPVIDPPRLARAISTIVEAKYGGQLRRASVELDIERSLLSRLRTGTAKSMSVSDLSSIRKALTRDEFVQIERALVPESAAELLAAFDKWLGAEIVRALYRETLPATVIGRAMRSVSGWENQRAAEFYHLREVVAAKFPDVIRRFDDLLERRRHFQQRGDLAYVRVLSPLIDASDSALIERRWQEMSDGELRRFVEAGIERESILLDRPPDVQRAQEIAARDPIDFVALYGQEWDPLAFAGRGTNPLIKRWIAERRRDLVTKRT